jgi:multicomponent Na+:H+ antiporter subunit E
MRKMPRSASSWDRTYGAPMSGTMDSEPNMRRAIIARASGFLLFWLILSGAQLGDLPMGMAAAAVATWASLRLLPPGPGHVRPVAMAWLALRFLRQSIAGGIDVAWRALDPRLPLRPGFVVYRPRLSPGTARSAFCTLTSMLPGTLPCEPDGNGALTIHCLDVGQPVTEQLAAEEGMLVQALGGGYTNG